MATELQIKDVSIDVVFKEIKNLHLSVYPPTGRVRVSAPSFMNLDMVRLFAISKINWIRRHQDKIQDQPRETPREYIERESHYIWGRRYLLRIQEEPTAQPSISIGNRHIDMSIAPGAAGHVREAMLKEWYRETLRERAQPVIEKWERQLNVNVEKLYIQKMRTKWGSSNPSRRTIRLNLDLAKFAPECLDYVVLHEMTHFHVPNHSEKFVNILDRLSPGWRAIRDKLNEGPLSAI